MKHGPPGPSFLSVGITDALFPAECPGCGRRSSKSARTHRSEHLRDLAAGETGLCEPCASQLAAPGPNRCTKCSAPLPRSITTCERCRRTDYDFNSHVSAFLYNGAAAGIMRSYKFGGRRSLAHMLAVLTAAQLPGPFRRVPLVPVPSTRASRRKRGFDAVLLFAREIASLSEGRVHALLRKKEGADQKSLDLAERRQHIAGRFVLAGPDVPNVIVLVDDVFTTGATVSECARMLRRAGADTVHSLSFVMQI